MSNRYTSQFLTYLRNDILIDDVIQLYLNIPSTERYGKIKFTCPLCTNNNTSTNHKTNLARCFDCRKNYNPIDLVIVCKKYSFSQAVDFLENSHKKRIQHNEALQEMISTILKK